MDRQELQAHNFLISPAIGIPSNLWEAPIQASDSERSALWVLVAAGSGSEVRETALYHL